MFDDCTDCVEENNREGRERVENEERAPLFRSVFQLFLHRSQRGLENRVHPESARVIRGEEKLK